MVAHLPRPCPSLHAVLGVLPFAMAASGSHAEVGTSWRWNGSSNESSNPQVSYAPSNKGSRSSCNSCRCHFPIVFISGGTNINFFFYTECLICKQWKLYVLMLRKFHIGCLESWEISLCSGSCLAFLRITPPSFCLCFHPSFLSASLSSSSHSRKPCTRYDGLCRLKKVHATYKLRVMFYLVESFGT